MRRPIGPLASMTPAGVAMRCVLLASRETPETVRRAVGCLVAASRGTTIIDVLVNGNAELARALAVGDWRRDSADVDIRLWLLELGDKANAWNRYVHDLWSPAACTFFVDGYVRVRPDALALLAAAGAAAPEALAATGVPTAGRSAAMLRESMLEQGGIHGNLHMLTSSTMEALRRSGFRLPLGIYRTDSTIGAALGFGLDPSRNGWDMRKFIAVCEQATWDIDEQPWWSYGRVTAYWKRRRRQAQGDLENAAVRALIAGRKLPPEQLPRTVEALVLQWAQANPDEAARTLRGAPLRRAALDRLRRGRDWSRADDAAAMLASSRGRSAG